MTTPNKSDMMSLQRNESEENLRKELHGFKHRKAKPLYSLLGNCLYDLLLVLYWFVWSLPFGVIHRIYILSFGPMASDNISQYKEDGHVCGTGVADIGYDGSPCILPAPVKISNESKKGGAIRERNEGGSVSRNRYPDRSEGRSVPYNRNAAGEINMPVVIPPHKLFMFYTTVPQGTPMLKARVSSDKKIELKIIERGNEKAYFDGELRFFVESRDIDYFYEGLVALPNSESYLITLANHNDAPALVEYSFRV